MAEQPLPPNGACLLGSFNLTKYIDPISGEFSYNLFQRDIPIVVRAMDNVNDIAIYPLEEQKKEAQSKRRMGLGVTGLANTAEILGYPYGSEDMLLFTEEVLSILRDTAYLASVSLAIEKGPFPLFDQSYGGSFFETLPLNIQEEVRRYGIRNSHLLSIAPTGTISLAAGNVSSGIEPPFSLEYERVIDTGNGIKTEKVQDYAYREYGVVGRTALTIPVEDHVKVLNLASKYVDSSVSKTVNVGSEVTWEEFKDVYMQAYDGGASGCTTYRADGKRGGILLTNDVDEEGAACYIDEKTGRKTCE